MDLGVHYFQTNPHWTVSSISHYIPVKPSPVSQWYPEINPYPCWINFRCHQTRLAGKSTSNSSMIFPAINLDLVFGFSSLSCWLPYRVTPSASAIFWPMEGHQIPFLLREIQMGVAVSPHAGRVLDCLWPMAAKNRDWGYFHLRVWVKCPKPNMDFKWFQSPVPTFFSIPTKDFQQISPVAWIQICSMVKLQGNPGAPGHPLMGIQTQRHINPSDSGLMSIPKYGYSIQLLVVVRYS